MRWRFHITITFFVFCFVLIVARLFYWQIIRAKDLSDLGDAQYGRRMIVTPERGEIRTSDEYPIAANKLSYLVFGNPKEMKDKKEIAQKIASILKMDEATVSAQLYRDLFWVPIKSRVEVAEKERLAKEKIPGIGFEEQTVRYYPEASMAAQLLGFVGKDDNGADSGYSGLEGLYDRQLRGKSTFGVQIHDAVGNPILAKMSNFSSSSKGRSLTLHIDRMAQFILERELKNGLEKYGATSVMGAVMDPKTGGILAMSAFPSFDPRDYGKYSDELYKNPFITSTYEPGSTFKPLVMAEAIDRRLVLADTRCTNCDGPVSIGGYDIQTWNNKYIPGITMTETIIHSDNTGMVFIAQKLKLDGMISLLNEYGFGQSTGIDLQGETVPYIRERDNWYPIDLATSSFGQGISVTPIQLLNAFASIANNGKRMEPHVVASVETAEGEKIAIPPKVLNQTMSEKTAKIMTEMLVSAVDQGEAKWAKPKGYRIAGKTGTAQIPIAGHYDPTKTIASFIGFAPADDPKFVMLIIVDRPTTSIYGAETAAPIFFNVARDILTHDGISPTED